jgi:hypothetical protein
MLRQRRSIIMRVQQQASRPRIESRAYTFAEVMVSVLAVGMVGVSFYVAMSAGFRLIGSARENLRATQILVERSENLRLYSWAQLPAVATNFTEPYDPYATNSLKFYGKVSLSLPNNVPAAYQNQMRLVNMEVRWTNYNGSTAIPQYRQLQTFVSRYGIQNYVYGQ